MFITPNKHRPLQATARGVLPHARHAVWQQASAPKVVRTILAPVDLSPDSLHALERARDLALAFGARITMMQAFVPPTLGAYSDEAEPVGPTYAVEHVLHDQREHFQSAVERFDWTTEDRRLAAQPVTVDVGVVCLWLGRVAERRFIARRLAAELIQRADRLMYEAKDQRANHIYLSRVKIAGGALMEIPDGETP